MRATSSVAECLASPAASTRLTEAECFPVTSCRLLLRREAACSSRLLPLSQPPTTRESQNSSGRIWQDGRARIPRFCAHVNKFGFHAGFTEKEVCKRQKLSQFGVCVLVTLLTEAKSSIFALSQIAQPPLWSILSPPHQ